MNFSITNNHCGDFVAFRLDAVRLIVCVNLSPSLGMNVHSRISQYRPEKLFRQRALEALLEDGGIPQPLQCSLSHLQPEFSRWKHSAHSSS
jgi:hypothetical protein